MLSSACTWVVLYVMSDPIEAHERESRRKTLERLSALALDSQLVAIHTLLK